MHFMHLRNVELLTSNAALLGHAPGHVTLTFRRIPPTSKTPISHRAASPVTMQALKRADRSAGSFRSVEVRMYSSFLTTLREMQQDTHIQQQQQAQHQVQCSWWTADDPSV